MEIPRIGVITPEYLKDESYFYSIRLTDFEETNNLHELAHLNVDHCGIKVRDSIDFNRCSKSLRSLSVWEHQATLNNRRIYVYELKEEYTLDFGPHGTTRLIELMEPRPEKVGLDLVGTDHIELLVDDFAIVETAFKERRLGYELQANQNHATIVRAIHQEGPEVKYTMLSLRDVTQDELIPIGG
jgi:hypothetical protein